MYKMAACSDEFIALSCHAVSDEMLCLAMLI